MNYKNEKPLFYLTHNELKSFNIESYEKKEIVGYFTSAEKAKEFPLFDMEKHIKHLPVFPNKASLPKGFVTKGTAYNYGIKISTIEKPAAIVYDEKKGFINAAYDKTSDKTYLRFSELINVDAKELLASGLPVFETKDLPGNFLPVYQTKGYFLEQEKKPCALYRSRQNKLWHVFDLKKELEKPHYEKIRDIPFAYFTLGDLKKEKLPLLENEKPIAYYKVSKNTIFPLYDRTKHPKYRLKILTGGAKK